MSEYINILSRVHNIEQILVGLVSSVNDIRNRPQQELLRIKNLENRVAALEQTLESQTGNITALDDKIGDIGNKGNVQTQIDIITSQITDLTTIVNSLVQKLSET